MNKEKIIIELNNQIELIKAHVNRLKRNENNIHILDIDMLKKKTYEFYDLVFVLEHAVADGSITQKKTIYNIKPQPKEPEIIIQPVAKPIKTIVEPIVEKEYSKPIIEKKTVLDVVDKSEIEIVTEPVMDVILEEVELEIAKKTIPQIVITSKNEKTVPQSQSQSQPESQPQPEPEPQPEPQTTYDLFSGNSNNVIAQKFQSSDDQNLSDRMQKTKISNIREAIGINEKFLFLNQLFNGDLSRYNKILDDINELSTKQGVDTYIFELKIQSQWADDNEALNKLKELISRKFI